MWECSDAVSGRSQWSHQNDWELPEGREESKAAHSLPSLEPSSVPSSQLGTQCSGFGQDPHFPPPTMALSTLRGAPRSALVFRAQGVHVTPFSALAFCHPHSFAPTLFIHPHPHSYSTLFLPFPTLQDPCPSQSYQAASLPLLFPPPPFLLEPHLRTLL